MNASTPQRILADRITEHLLVEKRGPFVWLTFNDPARHNAVSYEMWEGVAQALETLHADPEVLGLVFTGAGDKSFVSGANIKQFDDLRTGRAAAEAYELVAERAQLAIFNFPKPTLARIHGYCIGGGLNIALCCDLRVASENSQFSIPAGRLGLGYRLSAIRNLVTAVGPAQALEIFLTASRFNAQDALRRGLLHACVPYAELDSAVAERLTAIEGNAPLTLQAGKFMIRQLQKMSSEVDFGECQRLLMQCFASEDYAEGKRAFAEKRKPVFKGR